MSWNELSPSDCEAELRPLVRSITYQDLFRPVLEATYTIREKGSDRYMTESGFDIKVTEAYGQREWKLFRSKLKGMPTYMFRQEKSRKYLVDNMDYAETSLAWDLPAAHWSLQLGSDGESYTIKNVHTSDVLTVEGTIVKVLPEGTRASGGFYSQSTTEAEQSQWILEESGSKAGGRFFKERQYKKQWRTTLQQIPIFPATELTWGAICPDKTCEAAYVAERTRLRQLGKISETKRNVVTETKVRGICDMTLAGLKQFARHPEVIRQLRQGTSAVCPQDSLAEFGGSLRSALERECFTGEDNCVAAIDEHFGDVAEEDCVSGGGHTQPTEMSKMFNAQLASDPRCAGVPADTVEGLKEFVMNSKCMTWHAPSPLWETEDKSPHHLAAYDNAGTCSGNSKATIAQSGTCPEGSKCKCPRTYLKSRDTAEGIREEANIALWTSAAVPASTLAGSFERKSPFFSLARGITGWSCQETVGCWPQRPEKTSTKTTSRACRMPAKALEGGSQLWFLPPPMLRLKHSWGKCVLEACKQEHVAAQQVGLVASKNTNKYPGKANVYNCQPLAFDEMTPKQQEDFLDALRASGAFEEYKEPALEPALPPPVE